MTNCPQCKQLIENVVISPIPGIAPMETWDVISYNCPKCNVSLGMQIDPIHIRNQIIKSLLPK